MSLDDWLAMGDGASLSAPPQKRREEETHRVVGRFEAQATRLDTSLDLEEDLLARFLPPSGRGGGQGGGGERGGQPVGSGLEASSSGGGGGGKGKWSFLKNA